ncbi:MAG: TonB-dependent receptor [Gammaproteobacteria bacterium]
MLKPNARRFASIAFCVSFAISEHAYADPQDGGAAARDPDARSAGALEEVTVTALRREESVNKVPISMTALSQSAMDDLHIQSLSDLTNIVPGLVIPPASSTNNANSDIAIRGIFSGGNTPTTQVYIDETPTAIREMRQAGPSGGFFPEIFDLERVEVLRGPQGTLFGSSAMGGAIRFITPQPSLEKSSGFARLEVASTQSGGPSYAGGLAYGAPIVDDKVGFRVSASFHNDGGFIDAANPFTGQIVKRNANASSAFAGRGALKFVPADGLSITTSVFVQHKTVDDLSSYWVRPVLGDHVSGDTAIQPYKDDITIPSLSVKYEMPGMTFQSDTSYLNRSYASYDDTTQLMQALFGNCILCDGIPASFSFGQTQFGGSRAWQQQFRLTSSSDSRLQWVAGGYFRKAHESITQVVSPSLTPLTQALYGMDAADFFGTPEYPYQGQLVTAFVDFNTVDEERSVFGEVSYEIFKGLKASAGVRVEHSVVKDQTQDLAGPFGGYAFAHLVLPDTSENPVNPRFSLSWQYTDRDMVYVTAAKGYRSGGANTAGSLESPTCGPVLTSLGIGEPPLTFASDSLWSYELGSKNSLLDGRLAIQASVFHIDWSGIQTQLNQQGCGTFTVNRGDATVNGFELQVEATPLDGFKVGGGVGYTDAYNSEAQYGAPTNGVAPLLNGSGDKLAMVLPWTAAVHSEYSWSTGSLWGGARAYVRADFRWQDGAPKANPLVARYDRYLDQFRDEAYSILNLRLGASRDGVDVSAFVNNASRADPALGFAEFGNGGPDYPLAYRAAIRPLTAGLTIMYRF